jgi:hypothetical protein
MSHLETTAELSSATIGFTTPVRSRFGSCNSAFSAPLQSTPVPILAGWINDSQLILGTLNPLNRPAGVRWGFASKVNHRLVRMNHGCGCVEAGEVGWLDRHDRALDRMSQGMVSGWKAGSLGGLRLIGGPYRAREGPMVLRPATTFQAELPE